MRSTRANRSYNKQSFVWCSLNSLIAFLHHTRRCAARGILSHTRINALNAFCLDTSTTWSAAAALLNKLTKLWSRKKIRLSCATCMLNLSVKSDLIMTFIADQFNMNHYVNIFTNCMLSNKYAEYNPRRL